MTNTDLSPEYCGCYECVGPEYRYTDDGHRILWNNLKAHTFGEPCAECGRPKSEYRDLGTKGYFECYYCDGPGYVDDGHTPPTIARPDHD